MKMRTFPSPKNDAPRERSATTSAAPPRSIGLPRYLMPPTKADRQQVRVAQPGTQSEREADRIAQRFDANVSVPDSPAPRTRLNRIRGSEIAAAASSPGQPLDARTRMHMEDRFGVDLGQVRIHAGTQAEILNRDLNARAFTQGSHIFFGAGQTAGINSTTAHEVAHVVQQGGGVHDSPLGPIRASARESLVHRQPKTLDVSPNGTFTIDMQPCEEPNLFGMKGYVRFVPAAGAPNSNDIDLIQIARLTWVGLFWDTDDAAHVVTMTEDAAQQGRLGDPGLETLADADRGIDGGFHTDVLHSQGKPKSDLSYRYVRPLSTTTTTPAPGSTVQEPPKQEAAPSATKQSGFKRSNDPSDIKSCLLYTSPSPRDRTRSRMPSSA
jgi:hypothetical protein